VIGAASDRPGRPLPSGFTYRPAADVPEMALSPEARRRVLAVMDDVARCRALAAAAAATAVIG